MLRNIIMLTIVALALTASALEYVYIKNTFNAMNGNIEAARIEIVKDENSTNRHEVLSKIDDLENTFKKRKKVCQSIVNNNQLLDVGAKIVRIKTSAENDNYNDAKMELDVLADTVKELKEFYTPKIYNIF